MAVLESNPHGWIVCHETFIKDVYKSVRHDGKFTCCTLNPVLFEVLEPFRKNKNETEDSDLEIKIIKEAYASLIGLFPTKLCFKKELCSNRKAKQIANKFYKQNFKYPTNPFLGGNSDEAIISVVEGEKYLFPKECAFYSYDITNIEDHLRINTYDFILMDPPWWNKFIRRKRKADINSGYSMLHNSDLIKIPIRYLLQDDGIIAVWCTSAPSHIKAVLTSLFPAWDVEFISQWFWLKLTKYGEPICAFSPALGKQPYERIIFGIRKNITRKNLNPENNKVIMSVPSAIHSHKPPICDIMKAYLPENAKCLELFARYLLPKWTSYGNEVLKLQHYSLYSEHEDQTE